MFGKCGGGKFDWARKGGLLCRGEGVDTWYIVEGKGSEGKGKARLSLDWVDDYEWYMRK